jgi:hypothetical protein
VHEQHSLNGTGSCNGSMMCTREQAVSMDGTIVPITLAHRRGLQLDGSHPCLLTGYGAYGLCIDAGYKPERQSLLDRGCAPASYLDNAASRRHMHAIGLSDANLLRIS